MKPGPKPEPWNRLSLAAILYADALEAEPSIFETGPELRKAKNRLRKAAVAYTRATKRKGRPRKWTP